MDKTCRVEWFDDVDRDSWLLAAGEYGLNASKVRDLDDDSAEIEVRGEFADVRRLVEDMRSGDVLPMCRMRSLDEDEYAEWLNRAVEAVKANRGEA